MTDQNIILSSTEKQEKNIDEVTLRSTPDVESQTIPDDGFFAHVSTRLTTHLEEPVCSTSHFLEAELLLLSFATGILDGVSFPEFSCFTSRQNGNTVLFAIAALKIPTRGSEALIDASHAAIALSMFAAAVFSQGQAANWLACRGRRWWLLLSNFVQVKLVVGAAVIAFFNSDSNTRLTQSTLALLALCSGMQVGLVRGLEVKDITTAMVTASMVDLLIDPSIFASLRKNRIRNRRVGFILALIAGSFVGGSVWKFVGGAAALGLCAGIKLIVLILLWFTNKAADDEGGGDGLEVGSF